MGNIENILKTENTNKEGSVIPWVFGKARVQGKILWMGDIQHSTNLTKLARYGDAVGAYLSSMWFAICAGVVSLLDVRANDKVLEEDVDYWLNYFNDGSQTFKPNIPDLVQYVAVGNNGNKVYSKDGFTYTNDDTDSPKRNAVAYGAGKWVSVGEDVIISTDGIAWGTPAALPGGELHAIIYDSALSQFISAGANAEVYTSPDGIVWTQRNSGSGSITFYGLIHAGDYYYACGEHSGEGTKIYRSSDSHTWADITVPFGSGGTGGTGRHTCMAYNGSRLVLSGSTASTFYSDDDGTSWTQVVNAFDYDGLVWTGTFFIGVGTAIAKSSDGATWVTKQSTDDLYNVTFGNSLIIAVGNNEIWVSADGETWFKQYDDTMVFYGVAFAQGLLATYANKLKGIAHIFLTQDVFTPEDMRVVFNSDGKAPKMEFTIQNILSTSPLDHPLVTYDGVTYGVSATAAIYEILTNPQFGLGISTTEIDLDSFNEISDLFYNNLDRLYGLNIKIDNLMNARDVIDKIKEITDVFIYYKNGKYYAGSLYLISSPVAAVLVDTDFCSPLKLKKKTVDGNYNAYEGEYLDPDFNYDKKQVMVVNEAAFSMAGVLNKKKIDLSLFISSTPACQRLNEIMQRDSQGMYTGEGTVNSRFQHLVPGDIIQISSGEYGITGYFRITDIGLPGDNELNVSISFVQAFEDLYDKNYTVAMAARGIIPQRI